MYSALRDPSGEYGWTPRSRAGMVFLTCTPWSWTSCGSRDSVSWTRLCVSMSAVLMLVPILKITVVVIWTVGGTMFGYWATGRNAAAANPNTMMKILMTAAKRG